MRRTLARIVAAAALVGALGCGAARPSKFYHLDMPEAVAPANPSGPSLLIGKISAPHFYRDDRIVYRTPRGDMGTYENHRWAEPPSEMLEAMLQRMLRGTGKFRSVQPLRSNARGDFILRGRLDIFEEIVGPPLAARVEFEIELYDRESGTTVWSRVYTQSEPVSKKEVPALVQAFDRNVRRGMEQVIAGLGEYFAAHPPK